MLMLLATSLSLSYGLMATYLRDEVGSICGEMVLESPSPNSESHSADLPFKNIPNLDPLLTSSEYNHCGAPRSVTTPPDRELSGNGVGRALYRTSGSLHT